MVRTAFVMLAVMFLIFLIDFYFLQNFPSQLGLASASFFAEARIGFALFIGTNIIPFAVLAELFTMHVKKRQLKPRNILVLSLLVGELLLVGLALLSLFDVLFSTASIYVQVPLMTLGVSLPTLIMALTAARVKPVRRYFESDRIAH